MLTRSLETVGWSLETVINLINTRTGGGRLMASYLWHGYTCSCGEKVSVFRFPPDQSSADPITELTVRCKNGHERTVRIEEIEHLDSWLGAEIEPSFFRK